MHRNKAYEGGKRPQQWNLFFIFFYFFAVLGLELRAYVLSHSISPFFGGVGRWVFFKIESCKLFAQTGFELRSS
jgi:hypothetical protein